MATRCAPRIKARQIRLLRTYRGAARADSVGGEMSTIRIETDGTSDLARVYLWLTRHRGQAIELDRTKRLVFGVPISGARAVIVAVSLQDDRRPGAQLGGVMRAISSRVDSDPVRLGFEGRLPGGLTPDEAGGVSTRVLQTISDQVPFDDLVENVA